MGLCKSFLVCANIPPLSRYPSPALVLRYQFWIPCTMQKCRERPGPFYHLNALSVYLEPGLHYVSKLV